MGEAEEGANAVGILWTSDDGIGVFEASSASQRCYTKTSDSGNKADAIFVANGTEPLADSMYALITLHR